MKKLSLLIIGMGTISIPTALVISCGDAIKTNADEFNFDDKVFSNDEALKSYINNNYQSSDSDGDKWSLYNGERNIYFDSPEGVYKNLDNYINEMNTYLPNDTSKISSNGRIMDYPISDNKQSLQKIYKGKDDNFYLQENDAINSLIQTHQAYRYNGIYFKNKDDFKSYLIAKPDVLKKFEDDFKYIQTFDGNKSEKVDEAIAGTDKSQLYNEANFEKYISSFVESNMEKVYKRTTTRNDGSNLISLDNMEKLPDDLSKNIPYIKLRNTSGKAEYNIDLDKDVLGSLIGPDVLSTEVDPTTLITDINQWHDAGSLESPTNFTPASIAEEKMLDFQLTTSLPEGVKSMTDLLKYDMQDKNFLEMYKNFEMNNFSNFKEDLNNYKINIPDNENIGLFDALNKTEIELSKGKNYGFLSSLSILRSWLLDHVISEGIPSEIFEEINKSFDFATRVLNFQLHKRLDSVLSEKAKVFDISKVFDFDGVNKYSYGEMPKTYLQRFISGYDAVIGTFPEATEIILSAGLFSGILDEIQNCESNNNYSIPESFEKLMNFSPKSDILKSTVSIWKKFIKDDHLNPSKYKVSSDEYKQSVNKFSSLLSSQSNLMEEYSKEISDNESNISYKKFVEEKISSSTEGIQKGIEISKNIIDTGKEILDVVKNIAEIAEFVGKAAKLVELAGSAFPLLLIVSTAITVALDLFSAIVGTEKFDLNEYYHQDAMHQRYLWNGGQHKEHTFFGINFGNSDKVGLNSLKILNPIKIMSSSTCDMFYYNGKKYTSLSEVKNQYINDLKNGVVKNENIEYTLHIKSPTEDKIYEGKSANSIISELWKDKDKIFSTGYISSGGITYHSGDNTLETINQILDNIKPITIVELPDLKNGELIHPGSYRMPITNENYLFGAPKPTPDYSLEHRYWIYDPNIKQKPLTTQTKNTQDVGITSTPKLSNLDLITRFKTKYHIESKDVLKYEILKNKTEKYSDINRVISTKIDNEIVVNNLKTVFKAKSFDGEIEVFLNKGNAYKWLLNKMQFIFINVKNKSIYKYEDKTFLSIYEFMNWIINSGGVKHA